MLLLNLNYWRLFLLLSLLGTSHAQADDSSGVWQSLSKEEKAVSLNLGLAGFITIWGVTHWDYFQIAPTATSEGWFENTSGEGGADKMGHAFTSYAMSHALMATYEGWGFSFEDAARYGSLSALGIQTFMEFGDSFSRFGFAYEDFIANAVGSAAGYLSWRYPQIRDKVDFRLEYAPAFDNADVFTDYEAHKYVVALKLAGFDAFRDGPLKYLELHTGYYTRGYENTIRADNERVLYFGIGINFSAIAKARGYKKIGTFLNYYQVPYTYLPLEHDFND